MPPGRPKSWKKLCLAGIRTSVDRRFDANQVNIILYSLVVKYVARVKMEKGKVKKLNYIEHFRAETARNCAKIST